MQLESQGPAVAIEFVFFKVMWSFMKRKYVLWKPLWYSRTSVNCSACSVTGLSSVMQIRSAVYVVYMTIIIIIIIIIMLDINRANFREFAASIFRVEVTEDLYGNVYSCVN